MAPLLASLGDSPDHRSLLLVLGLAASVVLTLALVWTLRRLWRWLVLSPTPSVPVDEWRRRGLHVQPSRGVVEFTPGQRCPMCRLEHEPTSEAARCEACGALLHLLCARDLGGCAALGCRGELHRVDAVRAR